MNGTDKNSPKPVDILLVEDNATDAELCMRALKKHNLANNVVWVRDGAEALDFVFRTGSYAGIPNGVKPKVILLDLRLPKVDGIEVLRRLKGDEHAREIPVAILTSSKEDRDLKDCYRLGVNSYITKPMEFDQFADTIAKLGLYWLVINRVPS
jgi:two-component system response regulator